MEKYFLGICRSIWSEQNKIYIENIETDTEVAVQTENNLTIVVFKPTNSKQDHYYNFDFKFVKVPWMPEHSSARIHSGFMTKLVKVSEEIDQTLMTCKENSDSPPQIVFTGFSQGGAMAQLAAHRYQTIYSSENIKVHCYAYGSPRVGNKTFARNYNQVIEKSCRVYYRYDPVPSLPPKFLFYSDTKNPLWIKKNGVALKKDRPWWKSLNIIIQWKFKNGNNWKSDHGSQILYDAM